MEGAGWIVHCVLLFTQLTFGITYVLNKVALNNGVNKIVFSVYRDIVAICFLVPLAFFCERGKRTNINLKVGSMMLLLGFLGVFGAQLMLLTGLALTSSGFASIMQSATPVYAFVVSIVFRLEIIRCARRDGQAKVLGVMLCVAGAFIGTLWKSQGVSVQGLSSWHLGALCLTANSLCMALFINLQGPVLKRYPAPFSTTAISYICGAVFLAIVGVSTVEPSEWRITRPMDAVAFIYAGIVSSGLNFALQTWCIHKAGPFLVIAYFPLQAIVSSILSFIFLGNVLSAGSVVAGVLIISGLYLVTWGQAEHRRLEPEGDTESLLILESAGEAESLLR